MGSGFRTFQSGEVLTASNVQNYLMEQSIMVFAGTAALGSAIGTAVEAGMVAYLTDTDQLIHYMADAAQGTAWQGIPMDASNRNVFINGAMQISQRGTSTASITTSGYYTVDRMNTDISSLGTYTNSTEADGPSGSGFAKSAKLLCTTADATPAAGDYLLFQQKLEGQNLQAFLKGTSSAKPFALSFWVKSNKTGTYIVELQDTDNTRAVSASYTISASATWEKKIVIFPADTTGAFDNDNAASLSVNFWLGAGTTYTSGTLATTWGTTTNANRAVGQTNLSAAINNYWQSTGVQLESGSVSSPFEFEDIGITLAKCQRYYQTFGGDGANESFAYGLATSTTVLEASISGPVTMRTVPTATFSTATNFSSSDGVSGTTASAMAGNTALSSKQFYHVRYTTGGTLTQYRPYRIEANATTSARANFSAEL